ncbi:MAG TPA: NUDIX domain-containing protein, partial [Acidobacteriaceae bacterium]|nr:NUDIX domain-containing protein [Acidobacteriaceae bacterium]
VELGETVEEAVVREVLEETGLRVEPIRILKVIDRIHREDAGRVRYHYVLVDFLCHVAAGNLIAGSDAAEACWANVVSLTQYSLEPLTADMVQQALAYTSQ